MGCQVSLHLTQDTELFSSYFILNFRLRIINFYFRHRIIITYFYIGFLAILTWTLFLHGMSGYFNIGHKAQNNLAIFMWDFSHRIIEVIFLHGT